MDQLSNFLNQLLVSNPSGPAFLQILLATLVAYAGGVLSSFTPCVYPMIPITVGVIGGFQEKTGSGERPWKQVAFRIAAYLGGMVFVYSVLGVAAGLTGKIFGTFTNTSAWYLILGGILTFAALTMAEVIPFDPATWIQNFLARFKKHHPHGHSHVHHGNSTESLWGAAGLGASSGILSSPCTTPVLTVILAFIAKSQSVVIGLSLMVGFSLGLGTLLIVISLFTGALQILPRSGKWMKTVKVISGLLLLAFGEYLIFKAGTMRVQ